MINVVSIEEVSVKDFFTKFYVPLFNRIVDAISTGGYSGYLYERLSPFISTIQYIVERVENNEDVQDYTIAKTIQFIDLCDVLLVIARVWGEGVAGDIADIIHNLIKIKVAMFKAMSSGSSSDGGGEDSGDGAYQ